MTLGYYSPTGQVIPGQVTQPTPCRGCGQDLQGLQDTQRCSKCGLPVGRTLQPGTLQYAPPAWLAIVRSGLLLEFWTVIIGIIVVVLIAGGFIFWLFKSGQGGPQNVQAMMTHSPVFTIAIPVIVWIFSVLLTYGIWLITTPEPPPGAAPEGPRIRQATRALAIFGLVLGAINTALQVTGLLKDYYLIATVAQVFAMLIAAAQFVALLLVLSELGAFLPDVRIASRARMTGWSGGIIIALIGLMQLLMISMVGDPQKFAARGTMTPGIMIGNCVNMVLGLSSIVSYIFYMVTLMQLAGRIKRARAHSESILQAPIGIAPIAAQPIDPAASQGMPGPYGPQ